MNKPSKRNFSVDYYEWSEVQDYLEDQFQKNIRDWAGKFGKDGKDEAPYQDFWHWIINHYDVENGGFLQMTPTWDLGRLTPKTEWCRPILEALQEFGEEPLTVRTFW